MKNNIIAFPAERVSSAAAPAAQPAAPVSLMDLLIREKLRRSAAAVDAAAEPVEAAPAADPEYSVTTRPGYMGAVAWDGSNSHRNLYGADLSKAIREALKKDGQKGVTIRVSTYSGGQSITVTVKATPADYLSLDEYTAATKLTDFACCGWLDDLDTETRISVDDLYQLDADRCQRLHRQLAARDYRYMTEASTRTLNHFHLDDYKLFTPAFMARLHRIRLIVDSFNYDDSNSMVDYFERGFYEHFYIKNAGK